MNATRLAVPELGLFQPRVCGVGRGVCFESYNQRVVEAAIGLRGAGVQHTRSEWGVGGGARGV